MLINPCQRIVVNFSRLRPIVLFLIVSQLLSGCARLSGRSFKPSIPGYREDKAVQYVLSKKLLEISGQVSISDHEFVAINDEEGRLNFFGLGKNDKLTTKKFSGKGDYEDIVRVPGGFFVVESNGDLYKIDSANGGKAQKFRFRLTKKIEFESLVYYSNLNKLVLITKDHGLKDDAIYGYAFDIQSEQYEDRPFFVIPRKDILRKMKDYSAEFKPSAAALHPITGQLYILASIGKQIIICSPNGRVEQAYDLNPDHFPQPEGISFASNGDMYISNEGLQGKATILKFQYNQQH